MKVRRQRRGDDCRVTGFVSFLPLHMERGYPLSMYRFGYLQMRVSDPRSLGQTVWHTIRGRSLVPWYYGSREVPTFKVGLTDSWVVTENLYSFKKDLGHSWLPTDYWTLFFIVGSTLTSKHTVELTRFLTGLPTILYWGPTRTFSQRPSPIVNLTIRLAS